MSAGRAAYHILAVLQHLIADGGQEHDVERLTTALDDVTLLHQTNEQLQKDVRAMRDQSVRDAREITRLMDTNEALNDRLHAVSLEQQRTQMAI